jgi:hypothetical protein
MLKPQERLNEIFQFMPYPPYDPVPWWLFELDREILVDVARVRLDLYRTTLEAQIKAAGAIEQILTKR